MDRHARAFHIVPAGDAAFMVEFAARPLPRSASHSASGSASPAVEIQVDVNARVVALWRELQARAVPGVRDLVPAYATLAVYFDPLRTDVAALMGVLEATAAAAEPAAVEAVVPLHVPVCYGGEWGPDLHDVAREAGMSADEVIAAHTQPTYRVFMLGFLPGFAYMGTVDPRLVLPRRATPRLTVPAGSVAVAGRQTGIYPTASPGGWHLLGRTPIRPFVPDRTPAFFFQPGDAVQFHAVSADEFRRLSSASTGSPGAEP